MRVFCTPTAEWAWRTATPGYYSIEGNMMTTHTTANPILPAAGVRRNLLAAGQGPGPSGLHDDGFLNPSGRDQSDFRAKATAHLLKCKKSIILSTFNAFTIRDESRSEEMAACSEMYGIDVLGIQEHRRVHEDIR